MYSYIIDHALFYRRDDAESALNELVEIAEKYDYVTVADYEDVCDIEHSSYVANKYGWMLCDIKRAHVCITPGGHSWEIMLPAPYNLTKDIFRSRAAMSVHAHFPAKNKPGEPISIDIYTKEILNMDVVDEFVDKVVRGNPDRPVNIHIK